jgi:hypothetical protein
MFVMAGLVPAIHDLRVDVCMRRRHSDSTRLPVFMDGRDKPGHDVFDKMIESST